MASTYEQERLANIKKGEKMVKSAKTWHQYWLGIDFIAAYTGFDTDEEYDELVEKLDVKFGHKLSTK